MAHVEQYMYNYFLNNVVLGLTQTFTYRARIVLYEQRTMCLKLLMPNVKVACRMELRCKTANMHVLCWILCLRRWNSL